MIEVEKAQLFDVNGPADKPTKGSKGIPVQFNPTSLKVTLANSLKENERSGNTRATQYVDKSSSSLSVELIFDTTLMWDAKPGDTSNSQGKHTDVRLTTKAIAQTYMFQPKAGDKKAAPKRCMFVWGTFSFVGVMESFDETLDFFAPEGTPLRSTVSIKMTESRFQYESGPAKDAAKNTPTMGSGSDSDAEKRRDVAMYNGLESLRTPTSGLSIPSSSMDGGFGGGIGGGISGGIGVSGGLGVSVSGGASLSAGVSFSGGLSSSGLSSRLSASVSVSSTVNVTAPSFSFGSSATLGSSIPGAFSVNGSGSLTAGSIVATNSAIAANGSLFSGSTSTSGLTGRVTANASVNTNGSAKASASLGFD